MPSYPIKPSLLKFSAESNAAAPKHFGTRYNSRGQFLHEPGNTIVSHLVNGSTSEKAVIAVRERMMLMPEASSMAWTPISSLHMTLFQGLIIGRRMPPFWPEDMPLDMPIDETTAIYEERLKGFKGAGPFQVKAIDITPNGLTMAGASEADVRILREWRDQLAEVFGYRHPDHETYVFHITFAYIIEWLPPERLHAWANVLGECLEELNASAPIIDLVPPAFCRFKDMNHFEELVILA